MADLYLVTVKSVGPSIESLRSNAQLCIFTSSVHLCARQRVSTQDILTIIGVTTTLKSVLETDFLFLSLLMWFL